VIIDAEVLNGNWRDVKHDLAVFNVFLRDFDSFEQSIDNDMRSAAVV